MEVVVNSIPRPLYSLGKRPDICRTGGWLGPRAGLHGYRKFRPHRGSIPEPRIPYLMVIFCEAEIVFLNIIYIQFRHGNFKVILQTREATCPTKTDDLSPYLG